MQTAKMNTADNSPSLLSVAIGGYMGSSYSVEKTENSLLYKCYGYGYELKATEMIIPSLAQWESFMQTLDKIGVWNWQPEYSNPGILDGTSWRVEIAWGNKKILSQGNNNYPGGEYDSNEFQTFIRALSILIGGKEFS